MKISRGISSVFTSAFNILLLVFSILCVFPIVWILYSSLKSHQEFSLNILSFPTNFHFENYVEVFWNAKLYQYFLNSVFLAVVATFLTIVIGFITGYFLARFSFKGRNLLYMLSLFGMLIPVYGLLVPVFIEYRYVGFLDNRFSLVLPAVTFALPLVVFLIESFIKSVPIEVEEASYVDGTNIFSSLALIVYPLCRPIIATCIILSFLNIWNEFPFSLVLINSQELKTLPVGLTNFVGQYTVNYPQLMSGINVAVLPVILIYLSMHKRIIEGMVAGAVKG
ncbi:carbohydrate ABC transporter permease [Paenibacillus sp. sgz302251]|uniref:carbohydrate ABC transporter permease n=1 Tax=Paenibacillus sp. sgz302251 TaxID=3414493 RepID=UPI003C7EB57C